ncbi:DUF4079 domain-containing protein [Synechococcus sp. CS-1325]|uniref:DUF4079 domain-containing protein n=1 Tax=unclassified Synechococcus TaxID=2626047 RepID=UPI000DB6752A|nr:MULTISPECIES: DUF4079 domain-containing protein [unclassified Synechococcus]PZV01873.1 MAG: DUF4079 domain-containing protein [Cyanobium sp.]MCT0198316.1 DUF4079 domain-containing protein [Synechococcus sp. CS-1325]MCT0212035.1 DUF4079 domain-containing protein [Synechococcus sp. CS-1326]MCT0230486.1 DUF4079 domain-containing protein [Synechococcus sp. CS-1324]MCT0232967.1 DUF4079 domain-containing protein [Synechococcus sp. CS-1327]
MTPIDWFSLLHPVLVILFVYPVVGATIRLGILARERRLKIHPLPPTVGVEHADHGRWLSAGVVVAVLIALTYSFLSKAVAPEPPFSGGASRLALLMLVAAGTFVSLLALWWVKRAGLRASFALLTWAGLLGLGSQPEIWRLSDNPFSAAFWSSHYWSGVLLTGLMLFSMAAKPEIFRSLRMKRLHVSANVLVAVLLAVQAITGSRDLLEIPLSWQKPTIYGCNFETRTCPPPAQALLSPASASLSRASAAEAVAAPIS